MIKHWYAVKNEAKGEFGYGFPANNDEEAKQIFKVQVLSDQQMRIYAEDLILYNLNCTYETETGTFIQKIKEIKEIERGNKYAIKIFDIADAIRGQNSVQ